MANKLLKKKNTVQKVVKKQKAPAQLGSEKVARTPLANVTIPKGEYVSAVGRRKTATARVRVYKEAGDFVVNGKVVGEYFRNVQNAPTLYNQPFQVSDTQGKHAVSVKVSGSGISSQLDAVVHGVARALIKLNPDLRPVVKKKGLLTRDDRMKETRKMGKGGKARRTKQSPKR
jgi:small subunit ribosomal protein S9